MKNYIWTLTLALILLLSGCSSKPIVCPPLILPDWMMEPSPVESNLTQEVLDALRE